jgi:hypothetical protein
MFVYHVVDLGYLCWLTVPALPCQAHTGRPCEDIEEAELKAEHIVEEAMSEFLRYS